VTEPGEPGRLLEDALRYLKDEGKPVVVEVVTRTVDLFIQSGRRPGQKDLRIAALVRMKDEL